jgi:hypothetical protein
MTMSVTPASGYPQYADSDIAYIPQLYAASTLVKYYAKSVVPAITNTKYEGEIKDQGDKVIIRTRPNITIRDYKKGQKLEKETPQSEPVTLSIDKAKYYDFVVDDVDDKQADIVLGSEFTDDGSEQMRIAVDTDVLGAIYADADTYNQGATAGRISQSFNLGASGAPVVVTKQNVVEILTIIGCVMDEYNVPEEGRNIVLPAWFRYLVMNSDLKNASITGDGTSIVRNGRVGQVDRLTLFMSNLLSVGTDGVNRVTHIIASQQDAITYAAQLVKNETLRASDTFGREYRGLQVYGYKAVKPQGLVHLYAMKG